MDLALGPGERGSGLRSPSRRLDFRGPAHPAHPRHPPPVRSPTPPHPLPPFRGSFHFIHPPPGLDRGYSRPPPPHYANSRGRGFNMDHRNTHVGPHPFQDQDGPRSGHRSRAPPPLTRGGHSNLGHPSRPRPPPPPHLPPSPPISPTAHTPPSTSHPPITSVSGPRTIIRVPPSVARAIFPSLKPGEASHLFWAGNVESSDPRISQFCRILRSHDDGSPAVLQKVHPPLPEPLRRPAAGPNPTPSPPGFPRGRAVLHAASNACLRGALPNTDPSVNSSARQPTAGRRPFQAGATTAPQDGLSTPPSPAPTPAPAPSPDL